LNFIEKTRSGLDRTLPFVGRAFARGLALLSCLLMPLQGGAWAQVIADGRTATTISGSGSVSNVHTGTISQGHGVNSFVQFNVGNGQTLNIHVPNGAAGTLNIVNGGQSAIHGMVNSIQNGSVGGNLYIANPNGFVVGPSGVIRGGSVSLSTPSQSAIDGVFGPSGMSGSHVTSLLNGTAPLGPGHINMHGRIEAQDRIGLRAGGTTRVDGVLRAGGVGNGQIIINGQQGVTIGPNARITAQSNGGAGGRISVTSPRDITLRRGARVLSQSTGARDAGTIYVFAQGSALLEPGAVVSAAALGRGAGGFVEFSAKNTVDAFGTLEAWSNAGEGGEIFIDPLIFNTGTDAINTNGADCTVLAEQQINVEDGVILNTVGGSSVGDIILTAPRIAIGAGAKLIALNPATMAAGDITITARVDDRITDPLVGPGDVNQNALPIGSVQVAADGAEFRGGDVSIRAEIFKDNLADGEATIDGYADALFGPNGALVESEELIALAGVLGDEVQGFLDKVDIANQPMFLSATAKVLLDNSYVEAAGDARVEAVATTQMNIAPENQNLALALGVSNTVAEVVLHNTAIDAGQMIDVRSTVHEEQKLIGKSGVQDADVDATAFNVAVAASLRRARARRGTGSRLRSICPRTGLRRLRLRVIRTLSMRRKTGPFRTWLGLRCGPRPMGVTADRAGSSTRIQQLLI
jgi:filamentous hemagglutinin family protein